MVDETDPWRLFSSASRSKEPAESESDDSIESRIERLAQEYAELEKHRAAIVERMGFLTSEIAHYAPEDADEHTWNTEAADVSVVREERWTWNQGVLREILGSDTGQWPSYVRRTLHVDKRAFKKLDAEEQERLKPALTRNLQKPKVKVKPNVQNDAD